MNKPIEPILDAAVRAGLIPRDFAEAADAFAEELATKVCAGELTVEEANRLAEQRALTDAAAAKARGWPHPRK